MRTITYFTYNYLQANRKKRNHRDLKVVFSTFFLFATAMLVWSGLLLTGEMRRLNSQLPTFESISSTLTTQTNNSFLYDRNGKLIYTFRDPNTDREYMHGDEITDTVKLAVLAAEDKEFYQHDGIDYLASIRGLFSAVGGTGGRITGGSTITQQLAKNSFLTNERTVERKVKEIILSTMIEANYDKELILEYYLNTVTFGSRITGLKTAAKSYFNKPVTELNLNEAAFLISIVQSPNELSPLYSPDQQAAWELNDRRRDYVLGQVTKNYDYFSELFTDIPELEQVEIYKTTAIELDPLNNSIVAPHFVFYIQSLLGSQPYNISEQELFTGGYKIYTTLDAEMQRQAAESLQLGVATYGPRYGFSNAAMITIDPRNGEILAMQGSKDYWGARSEDGKFDPKVNVTLSSQNLGSSLKPFLGALAMDQNLISRYSLVFDTPRTFAGGYRPKNVDGKFLGTMTFDRALKLSRNLPFVKLQEKTGTNAFNQVLTNLGYTNSQTANYGLAASLGGVSETLFDHAFAYSTLANYGTWTGPNPISRIEDIDGNTKKFIAEQRQVFNYRSAQRINQILGDKSYRSSNHWMIPLGSNFQTAGKTGTTDFNKQNYFVGYSPNLLTAVWTGNNNNAPMSGRAFGSTTALPIWYEYMRKLTISYPQYFPRGNW